MFFRADPGKRARAASRDRAFPGDVTGAGGEGVGELVGHLRHHHGRRIAWCVIRGRPMLRHVCLVGFLRLPVVPAGVSGSLCFAGASCIIGLITRQS